jgi:hypothetical protein
MNKTNYLYKVLFGNVYLTFLSNSKNVIQELKRKFLQSKNDLQHQIIIRINIIVSSDIDKVHNNKNHYRILYSSNNSVIMTNLFENEGMLIIKEFSWNFHFQFLLYQLMCFLLGNCGIYPLHASAVAKNGKGILIIGTSGSGKSTLALLLNSFGYKLCGDDKIFIFEADKKIAALPFPFCIAIYKDVLKIFPQLNYLSEIRFRKASEKKDLISQDFSTSNDEIFFPTTIFFLERNRTAQIEKMSDKESLKRLFYYFVSENTPIIARKLYQNSFPILCNLVKSCKNYCIFSFIDYNNINKIMVYL